MNNKAVGSATFDFHDRVVLVTGGSSGIGNAAARLFLKAGAQVHVTGTRDSADGYRDKEGSDLTGLIYHRLDAANPDDVARFSPDLDHLDILVNSHGLVEYGRREFEMESFNRVLQVNLQSVMALCTQFKPLLEASGGVIINVGSVASFRQAMANPAYSASKGGLLTLTRTLASAWARDGIRVNLVAPGFIKTAMTEITHKNAARSEAALAAIPLSRWGIPLEIGHVILFLSSELASYITGEMVVVDGGMTL